ncbi:MAG: hypothetical protein IID17_06555 [Nitrospinae bacterium]|nr:hypothetical protein [Nitrospinota bacterium]
MFSRLQAAIPVFTEDLHVDRWVKKIFPWKMNRKRTADASLDQRECYRLDMKHLPPLDATLVSENGANIDLGILNLSAGGLCGKIALSVPLFKNQWLTVLFVLPLEEPLLMKTSACLIAIESNGHPDCRILRLQFSGGLDDQQKDLIHGFIVTKQFELIKRKREW